MATDITGSGGRKALRIILAILLTLVLLPALPSTRAFAAAPPASISGIFHLTSVGRDYSTHYGWVEVNGYSVASFSGSFVCTSSSAYNTWNNAGSYNPGTPTNWGTFTANWSYNNEAEGRAYYYVGTEAVWPNGASHGGYMQNLGYGTLSIPWSFTKGHVSLSKQSAAPQMTDGNPCYSLAGAEYGVYDSGGGLVGTIVTDESGYGSLGRDLELGWYYLRELKAPSGYLLDHENHWVELTEGSPNATVTVADIPGGDPFVVLLQKVDIETGGLLGTQEMPQGSASLAGAEYTAKYYQGLYDTLDETQNATPMRTWIVKTASNGYSFLDNDYLVSGDPLFYSQAGDPIIPFGTLTIVETKAPEGYLLPQPGDSNYKMYLTRYVPDSSIPGGVRIDGDGVGVQQGNEPKQREQVVRGDIELTKYLKLHEPDSVVETGEVAPEPQVIFDFYASRDFEGTTPYDGVTPAFSLTTDADGKASTIASDTYLIQNPDGSYTQASRPSGAAGGLPYDRYLCVQRTTDPAYEKCDPIIFTINQNGQVASVEMYDSAVSAVIRVLKLDAETGQTVTYPTTWQIYSQQTDRFVSMNGGTGSTDAFTSDSDGYLVLPEPLPYGSYLLHEVEAPHNQTTGYVLNGSDIPFLVTESHSIDDPLVITAEDTPAKGILSISKTGKRSEKPVAGAEYTVIAQGDIHTLDGTLRASDGETVAVLVTDERGEAVSEALYLGNYLVKETVSPDGYLTDPAEYQVNLTYADQQTALTERHLDMVDTEVFVEATKLDRDNDEPLPDTEFTLYRESEPGSDIWESVDVLVSDDRGKVVFFPVVKGSYKLVETRSNPAYASYEESGDEGTRFFTVDENSTSEIQVFYNEKIQLSCEIYQDTINITSSAFRTDDGDDLRIENVGIEPYHYTLDFRSTSNVRADEFTVVDPLDAVVTGGVRLKELFTPVARGDSDGFFNLWYQTNLTDTTLIYSSANAMSTNPLNVNNPDGIQNWPSVGWQLWQEALPTTSTTHLDVENLDLAPNEYITALRFEYGSVEVGFTTRDTFKQSLQTDKELKSVISDWSESQQDSDSGFRLLGVSELKPVTYLVTCSTALLPPTIIRNSATVNIARNVVLSDKDEDAVRTGVIQPFMMQTKSEPPTDVTALDGFDNPPMGSLPATGDNAMTVTRGLALLLLFAVLGLLVWERMRFVPYSIPTGSSRCTRSIVTGNNNRQ
ncbi:MAG: hypothetical protein LBK67_05360 [Coriobacteriales bacterium]|nr:hypothetical protein [Coriobacteriales bacterium]